MNKLIFQHDINECIVPYSHFGEGKKYIILKYFLSLEALLFRILGHNAKKKNSLRPSMLIRLILRFIKWFSTIIYLPLVKRTLNYSGYITLHNAEYFDIKVRNDSRPSVISVPCQFVSAREYVGNNMMFKVGVVLLQNIDSGLLSAECVVTTIISVQEKNKKKSISFRFPVNGYGTNIYYKLGENWIDYWLDLSQFNGEEVEVSFCAHFEKKGKKITTANIPCIAWSAPQIIHRKGTSKCNKAIILSYESLTDLMFLRRMYNVKFETPVIDELMPQSTVYERAYSQGDSTLGSMGGMLTGLYPSQHGIVDYFSKGDSLSHKIRTLAEILKENGFCTNAATAVARMEPYRWSRGFDSYFNVPFWSDLSPDAGYLIRLLENMKEVDGFLFSHIDWLHAPSIRFNHKRTPQTLNVELLAKASEKEVSLELYIEHLKRLDNQIGHIISYLKESGQYDSTLLILTGDHGNDLPPWGNHKDYALYEQRVRVPFIIKWPTRFGKKPLVIDKPRNASLDILPTILSAFGISMPEYFKNLPQQDNVFKGLVISETLMHPERDSYVISVVSKEFKYVMFAKIDWGRYRLKSIKKEKLYPVNQPTGDVVESSNIIQNSRHMVEKMRKLSTLFVERNLNFQKLHPMRNFYK